MPNFSWDFYILVASNDATAVRQFYAEILGAKVPDPIAPSGRKGA